MRWLIVLAVAMFPVGDGFGDATAEATVVDDDTISVDVAVEMPAGPVVVHLIEPGGAQQTVALNDRGGSFGAVFETRPVDLVVVFETLGQIQRQSEPARLTDLGVSRETLGMAPVPGDLVDVVEPGSNETEQWGWLGLGLAAAALALLAFWALGGDDRREVEPSTSEDEPLTVDSPA